ncbi:glucose dehydrogenase [FAD, quinone]-like [Temnothorax americanus]|uniref:glucose dehydrogenase [FAD, quinone]-like n=1 Tax=Temnothorax americanus TaxID=1964332 RepID=UPI00406807DF
MCVEHLITARHFAERAYAYRKRVYNKATTKRTPQSGCKSRAQRTRFLKTRRPHSRKMNVSEVPEAPCSSPFVSGLSLTDVCSGNSATLFLSMVNVLAAYSPIINGACGRITPIKRPLPIYDFIVVGGGAGGSVVASRLSEIHNWNVLLVEAGPDEPVGMQIPSNLQLYLNTELDWKYKTTNESYACLKTNGSCSWPRGKNLGGCTGHHGMAYHRGHEKDYARWVEMGNEGWSWNEVLPYFFKSEDNKEIGRVRAQDHGTGGPMTVERFPWQPQFAWDIMSAAKEVGLGTTEDLVGENIKGFTVAQTISNNGVRISTARAFLWPHRNRKNLHVALNAMATKVNTKKILSKVKADGITFIMNGRRYNVRARKEVILAAGTINSPQLLLLSGIGPKSHLKSVGIRPVVDLPGVGENLHNHQSFGVDFTLSETNTNELNINSADTYFYNQTGPMSSTGLAQLTGILASNYTTSDDPDIQIFFAGYQAICDTGDRIPDLKADGNKQTVRFTSVNLQALSRGRITLASNDPLHHPIIWSNDLANPQDRSIMYQGLQHILKLSKANAMKKYNLKMVDDTVPECEQYKKEMNYDYWDCQFRYNTRPENHQGGTCKMGTSSDPMAVVSPALKVHGVDGLRVADASVMPKMVSGNPVAAINMIGERVADFIKNDYKVIYTLKAD